MVRLYGPILLFFSAVAPILVILNC